MKHHALYEAPQAVHVRLQISSRNNCPITACPDIYASHIISDNLLRYMTNPQTRYATTEAPAAIST